MPKYPSDCIIYSGTLDIIDEHSPDTILDNLGSLISDLKEKNSNMNVYVCKIVPSPCSKTFTGKLKNITIILRNGVKQMVYLSSILFQPSNLVPVNWTIYASTRRPTLIPHLTDWEP